MSEEKRLPFAGLDVDTWAPPGQLNILEDMSNEEKTSCFDEMLLLAVSKFPEPEQNICKLLAVNRATSATILASVYSHLHGV